MTHVVLLVENHCVFDLLNGPCDILWVSKAISVTAEDGDWEIQERQIVVWWRSLVVLPHVLLRRTHVVSLESWFVSVDELAVMESGELASTSWHVRKHPGDSFLREVVYAHISIGEKRNKELANWLESSTEPDCWITIERGVVRVVEAELFDNLGDETHDWLSCRQSVERVCLIIQGTWWSQEDG